MKRLRIYLDTSVISFLYADDAPEKRDITLDFFEMRLKEYDVSISDVVLFEIGNTRSAKKRELLADAVIKYRLTAVVIAELVMDEINDLANQYISEGIIPLKKRDDAMHVAISTVLEFDILLSWNFEHLANINKQIQINALNENLGYLKRLNLLTPLGVMGNEDKG